MSRLRGLTDLVEDALRHGTIAVEKVHQSVARAPLDVLAAVPPLASSARWFAEVQAQVIATTYETIRETGAAAGALVRACLDAAGRARHAGPPLVRPD